MMAAGNDNAGGQGRQFTQKQTRGMRKLPHRDPTAWRKLIDQSRAGALHSQKQVAKASTSRLTLEDEDEDAAAQPRAGKRPRLARQPLFSPFRDDTLDDAVKGFATLGLDHHSETRALRDKSNLTRSKTSATKKHTVASSTDSKDHAAYTTLAGPSLLPASTLSASSTIATSTPTKKTFHSTFNFDFAALEAAELSIIPKSNHAAGSSEVIDQDGQPLLHKAELYGISGGRVPRMRSQNPGNVVLLNHEGFINVPPIGPLMLTATPDSEPEELRDAHIDEPLAGLAEMLGSHLHVQARPAHGGSELPAPAESMTRRKATTTRSLKRKTEGHAEAGIMHTQSSAVKAKKGDQDSKRRSPTNRKTVKARQTAQGHTPSVRNAKSTRVEEMRGVKGSLIRNTPARAEDDTTADSIGI